MMFNDETEVREKLDELRVSASKSSPMMETVRLCVQQAGAEELVPLVPRLVEVMKRGVGLSTKAAAAQLVVLLVHHCLHMLTPFAGESGHVSGHKVWQGAWLMNRQLHWHWVWLLCNAMEGVASVILIL